jgi:hypothetical protein
MGQQQTKKFLGDYGIADFSKTSYDVGKLLKLNILGYKKKTGDSDFIEQEHPREGDGKFAEKGGGSSSKAKRGSPKPVSTDDKTLDGVMRQIDGFYQMNVSRRELKFKNGYDVVLKQGKFFTPSAFPRPKGIKKGADKECYTNAGRLALDHGEYTYVEGFALASNLGGLPFAHAWCVDQQGNVIDPTWETSGTSYYGVPFSTNFLRETILKTKHWGLIPEMPDKKYNPFENGFPEGAIEGGEEETKDSAFDSEEDLDLDEIKEPEFDNKHYRHI